MLFFQESFKPTVASRDTVVQWLMVLCFYFVTMSCLLAVLHCTAFLDIAPLKATGCKIKNEMTPCTFGDAVKVHDVVFKVMGVIFNRH